MLEITRFGEVTQFKMARLMDGKPLYWVAAYLVDGLLIDTGCPALAAEFVDALRRETKQAARGRRGGGTSPSSRYAEAAITTVVNTHYHEDHVGGNRLIEEAFGVKALAHPDSLPIIAAPPVIPDYREMCWGQPEPYGGRPVPDVVTTMGRGYRFEVIPTPGHSPGHVSLLERRRGWCFTGDLFIGQKPRVVWMETDMGETVRSLRRLLAAARPRPGAGSATAAELSDTAREAEGAEGPRGDLGDAEGTGEARSGFAGAQATERDGDAAGLTLFSALGPVWPEGRRSIETCLAYLEDLGREAKRLARNGATEEAIADALFGGESSFAFLTRGEFSVANLVKAMLSADF